MAYNPYDPDNKGIGTLDLGNFGLQQQPEENTTVAEAINYGMLPQSKESFTPKSTMTTGSVVDRFMKENPNATKGDFVNALQSGSLGVGGSQLFDKNVESLFEGVNLDKSGFGWNVSPTFTGTTDGTFRGNIDIDRGALSPEALEGLPGGFFKSVGDQSSLGLPTNDKYAMAISNWDEVFGPKTMTDAFGTTRTLAAANKPDLYTGDLMAKTGERVRNPFAPLENQFMGPHDSSVYDRYGNIQMALEDQDFYEDPKGLAQLFQNLNIDPSAWGAALKNKVGTGWNFAKQIPEMAMSALGGMPGAAMGFLRNFAKPDTPYQKFQKQMFEDMGWQGESNKDPWGKNINSLFGDYDVTEQWGDLMGSKLGQKYGYKDAMADGVLDDAELAKMQELGLKGWQLNRAIGLSQAAKKAQNWKDKKAADKILTNKMKNIDTGGGKTKTYTPAGHYGKKLGQAGSWTPAGTHQGSYSPKGYSARSHSGGQYSGGHHWARGGRVGYANGGLASLFTRRG